MWKCPNCWTEYEIDVKFADALKEKKDCKFCVRKDPNIPTTAEMDGLLTQDDMRNRNKVVFQCQECNKWTTHYWIAGEKNKYIPCTNCGEIKYDSTSIKSLRTYDPDKDNKRKIKAAIKKKK